MDVKVVEVNHCAFVDFAEETAAARVVEKAQERPFCLGDDTLVVEVKKDLRIVEIKDLVLLLRGSKVRMGFILMYRYHTLVCLFKMWKQMAQI